MDLAAEFTRRWPGCAFDAGALDLDGLDGDHRDDVVLARAAAAGIPAAIGEFETAVIAPALATSRRFGDLDEVAQQARMRLLVADGGVPPKLATYRGRGSLVAFVRTIITRLALDHARATRDTDSIANLIDRVGDDPELAHMRERYAGELGDALKTAWAALARHDRFVLDLELNQHLGVEQIATIYGVHRTSAMRKIASARAAFVAGTRDALRAKLGVGDPTLDSILRLMTTSTRWTALAGLDA